AAVLVHIRGGDRETAGKFPFRSNAKLVGLRGPRVRVESEVDRWIDDRDDARILPGRLIERGRCRRRQSGMHGRRLTREKPLVKTALGRPEHGPAVAGEPRREAKARRKDVPRVQSSETMNGGSGLVS